MNIIPPNFHPFHRLFWPLATLIIMEFVALIIGLFFARFIPKVHLNSYAGGLALAVIAFWAWLTFYVHIFPHIHTQPGLPW
ncbi:hypothetical protein LLE49_24735 [Alicyclobacillus tolerans]|uniref:hypothetical protein n=1 Tax=Alicyclobacillus tolerans TaxID=90970 RepID=UPI001F16ED91|nr:hypothetical protein [Alicyclobacillus tolerans]MCF8567934.1 hypothetical protein [Alicyclobacillus tolerans]